MRRYSRTSRQVKKIVTNRIHQLFDMAEKMKHTDPNLSDRYVVLARKLSTKNKVRMPYGFSRRYCRHCNTYWIPGKNVRIRTRDTMQVYYCLNCRRFRRFPFRKERLERLAKKQKRSRLQQRTS